MRPARRCSFPAPNGNPPLTPQSRLLGRRVYVFNCRSQNFRFGLWLLGRPESRIGTRIECLQVDTVEARLATLSFVECKFGVTFSSPPPGSRPTFFRPSLFYVGSPPSDRFCPALASFQWCSSSGPPMRNSRLGSAQTTCARS